MPPDVARWPDVILVNGPSSAGKTTLCRSIQARAVPSYLCVGFDDFIGLTAPRYYRGAGRVTATPIAGSDAAADDDPFTAQGVRMVRASSPSEPARVDAVFGPVFRRVIDAMAPTVRTLVDQGNRVIFDHVLHDCAMYENCVRAFDGLDVFKVGVVCPIDVLEARERARGDRVIGRARGLVDIVHGFCGYDVEVDTGALDADGCADAILAALGHRPKR